MNLFAFFLVLILTFPANHLYSQTKTDYTSNSLRFQYGISLKGLIEFSLKKNSQKPVFRLCSDVGIGSNFLATAIFVSINEEIQLYNGGLASKRRSGDEKPALNADFITAFTVTAGFTNHFRQEKIQELKDGEHNAPLYYFGDFTYPALQNPYEYSFSVGTNAIFTTDKFKSDQRVGFFNLHLYHIQVSYFNDGGTPFDETKLGDSKDRYYTGGAVFSYHGKPYTALNLVELSFYKFTGYTKNAFEVSNKLDLAYVNYNKKEEKYYNKSLWTLNVSNPNQGWGLTFRRYNYTNWDVQHLIHFSIFNSYHLVPYDDYFSIGGIYYFNYGYIGLR